MNDIVINIGNSVLQHGKYNDRVYLMRMGEGDFPEIINKMEVLAQNEEYSKIIAKVPEFAKNKFFESEYLEEAHIPGFYNGNQDAYFMGKYFSEDRIYSKKAQKHKQVLDVARTKKSEDIEKIKLDSKYRYKLAESSDVEQITQVYKKVFETYPFPIHDRGYILKTMNDNTIYFGIWYKEKIIALSSTEMDKEGENAEMTNFAVLPQYRGNGFSSYLLQKMEDEMRRRGIKVVYATARGGSYGMNITFAKMGYKYSGTLINNTNICESFESMNVWYKLL